jgi:hypothetical protein
MIRASENVDEPEAHERHRRLVPARIQPDNAGIADEFERADAAIRGQEAQHGDDAKAQSSERGLDGELRVWRANRVLEQRVEQPVLPVEIGRVRQSLAGDVDDPVVV